MRIVFVGGGTGGHFYPLMAIAEQLRDIDQVASTTTELFYMGPDPYNPGALTQLNIKHLYCPAGKQRRYKSGKNFFDIFKIFAGIFVAFWKLLFLYPDAIMSKGGYTSVPVVFAGWLLRIPIVIHESDAVPGRANKFAARFARYIAIAQDEVAPYFPNKKVALVGMPIRKSFFTPTPDPHSVLQISKEYPLILITGGSSGSVRINNLILESLDNLLPTYSIIHQVGDDNLEHIKHEAFTLVTDQQQMARYYIQGHMTPELFAAATEAASIIISRAGSGTIFEIALKGKPSIIIPIPEDISHDQRTNAYAYAKSGAASVMEESNLTDDLLTAEIKRILEIPDVAATMSAAAAGYTVDTAAATMAETLVRIGQEHT